MTARAFKAFGKEIAEATRARLLAVPGNRILFANFLLNTPRWAESFGDYMLVIAENIGQLMLVSDMLDQFAERHKAENWTAEHYEIFLRAMLPAIRDVLGEGATDPVLDAWEEGFQYLCTVVNERKYAGQDIPKAA
jgi:hemoglobin-like flavoprotein